ncbi:hypothetical protein ACULNC_21730 [Shigella flexneri]
MISGSSNTADQRGQALYNRAQTQIEEAYRQIEVEFTAGKPELTHLLEEFIALGNSDKRHPGR